LGFLTMFSLRINENQIIWLALIVSLMIHGLLLVFSRTTFIPHAQFSVQPSAQAVEISIEEIKNSNAVSPKAFYISHPRMLLSGVQSRMSGFPTKTFGNDTRLKKADRSISGVKVRANSDYFQNPPPEYPELAKQMRQEGLVMLSVDVDRTGEPLKVEIIQSSGYRLLDQAALKAVSHWKFQPGSIANITVESTVTVPIRFRLEK